MRYSVQRKGLNSPVKKDKDRPVFNPKKVVFRSNYDRFGRIADDKEKQLSRASLSSDSAGLSYGRGEPQARDLERINEINNGGLQYARLSEKDESLEDASP